jgi:Flp pilus assembly protein TadG
MSILINICANCVGGQFCVNSFVLQLRDMKNLKNNSGSMVVEFALLAPVFFYMIFGIIEIFSFMLADGILESAVRQAGRSGLTGYNPVGVSREDFIRQQVEDKVFFINADNLDFETLVYSSFSNINQPEPFTDSNNDSYYDIGEPYTDINANGQWDDDMGVVGSGGAGDIVVYKLSYTWEFMTPFIGAFMSDDGTMDIVANAVVKNEPF